MRINLSGLASLDIPLAVFDEFFKKSQHFGKAMYPEGTTIWCDVVYEPDNPGNTEDEPALAVKIDNCTIGYIPRISTIHRYIAEAERDGKRAKAYNDLSSYEKAAFNWKKHSKCLPNIII